MDTRSRLRLVGLAFVALVAVYAAVRGDWRFAIVFAVAAVFVGLAVVHRIRQP